MNEKSLFTATCCSEAYSRTGTEKDAERETPLKTETASGQKKTVNRPEVFSLEDQNQRRM